MTDDSQQASGAVDTVLFDVDGTLIDSTYHHAIAWARAFARFDLYPPLWRVHRSIGMGGAVESARSKGYKVALASSGKEEFTDAALEKIGLTRDDFDAVTSSDDADNSKPEPDILEVALKEAGGSKGVLIGDATWDVEAAKKAGMSTMGLRTGGFSAAEMHDAGATDVVDAITDLRDGTWLDRLN